MSDLEIFELGVQLAKMLNGDKEAIADVKKLYDKHPEMFKNIQEVIDTINEVIKEPEIIIKNPHPKNDKDFIAVKHLESNSKKIGDIGIRNDKNTNVIFHTNISNSRNFNRFVNENRTIVGEAVHSLHTSRPAELGGNDKSSGAKAHSTIAKKIIANNTKENNIKQKIGDFFKHNKDKSNKGIDR